MHTNHLGNKQFPEALYKGFVISSTAYKTDFHYGKYKKLSAFRSQNEQQKWHSAHKFYLGTCPTIYLFFYLLHLE